MSIDIKTLIPILSVVAILGGFYYTTEHRLDLLEKEIEEISIEIGKVRKSIARKNK